MKNYFKKSGYADILASIIFAVIGIFMIVETNSATKIISYIIGGIFIVAGIIKIMDYLILKKEYSFYNYDIIYGIVAIFIGIFTIICSGLIESMFRIAIGGWIIYNGILRIYLSFKLYEAKLNIWITSLILSIIMTIGGIYMLLTNGALILTIGIFVLVYSVMNLVESIIFIKYVEEL